MARGTRHPIRVAPLAVDVAVRAWLAAAPAGPIGVACSGGVDSMALAAAVIAARGQREVVVLHVDHGLTPASGATGQGVAAWADTRGARALVIEVKVARRGSLEAAARTARYAALREQAATLGLVAIATAHTLDDQAETVLLRLVRGTGPAGLSGIQRRDGIIARPLLEVRRADTAAYVAAHRLPTWSDPMNVDTRFARVRARQAWLPLLAATNPAVAPALARLADQAAQWRAVLDAAATAAFGDGPLAATALVAAGPAIAAHALLGRGRAVGLELADHHVRAALALAAGPSRGTRRIDVPGGVIERAYDAITVIASGSPEPPAPVVRDADGPLRLRRWQRGDRMRPARLRGRSRLLSDLFADARVPQPARHTAWVAVDAVGAIVWAEYVGPAHRVALQITPLPVPEPARKGGSGR